MGTTDERPTQAFRAERGCRVDPVGRACDPDGGGKRPCEMYCDTFHWRR